MTPPLDRRRFLALSSAAALAAAAGCSSTGRRVVPGRMRHACVGVGGMGASDLAEIAAHPEVDVVALCDVDSKHLANGAGKAPGARTYRDWRELLAAEDGRLDSISVSTPDHMHAPITMESLKRGLHVYCQKPLTRTVHEARAIAREAARSRVVTQMGIQNHSNGFYDQGLTLLRQGHIGPVHEVHVWTDRPAGWWPQGVERQPGEDEVPENLDWDLWLGVAPERPYKAGQYHPFAWRGWMDFGTGAQGDMACHLMDPALWFLELGDPLRVRSDGPTPNGETYPSWSTVHYEFAATPHTTRGPLLLTWYDGGRKAPRELLDSLEAGEVWSNACLFVGTEGALLASPYESPRLLPESKFEGVEMPERVQRNHWHQWVDACRGEDEPSAPFAYSGLLTEAALLGNVALAYPHETLEWDARRLRFPNRPEADALLRTPYREGWRVRGLS